MGDDEKGRAGIALAGEEQVENRIAGGGIEIAGRLVGEEDLRTRGHRPGDRDALLLAARKLGGIMGETVAETDRLKLPRGDREGIRLAGQFQRYRDIFERGHGGKEVEGLEHDADAAAAGAGEAILVERGEIGAGDMDAAVARLLEAGQHSHQGGFARPGRPQQSDALTLADLKVDAAEDGDAPGALPERQRDIRGVDDDMREGHEGDRGPMSLRVAYGARRVFVHLAFVASLGAFAAPAAAEEVHVLAFGDSLTTGYGLPQGQGFVPQLEDSLRRNGVAARVTNGGVSGNTAGQARARLTWTLDGLREKPDLAIVALGGNDMLRGLPTRQTRADIDAIVAELRRRDIPVLVAGMLAAPNLGPQFGAEFNSIYPDVARKHGADLYPFFLANVAGVRGLNLGDGIHPNFQGIKRMVTGILPNVLSALGRKD